MTSRHREQGRNGRAKHSYFTTIALVLLAVVSAPGRSAANELKEQTQAAWDNYINSLCSRAEARAPEWPFLRISEQPDRRNDVQAGEIVVWREGPGHEIAVPHGLIHHWMGAVFIPNVTIADVLSVTRDYGHYPQIYKPAVLEAKKLSVA